LLLLPVQPRKGRGNPVKCLTQGHRKQTCPSYLHTIHFLWWTTSRGAVNQGRWQKNFQGGRAV